VRASQAEPLNPVASQPISSVLGFDVMELEFMSSNTGPSDDDGYHAASSRDDTPTPNATAVQEDLE
jgi:hypothetical protein